jgi:5-methylcytosine-specific restriction endonuclease McrA
MSAARPSSTNAAWQAQRERVLARDGWQCTACGVHLVKSATALDGATVDHVDPLHNAEDGYVYADHELVALCRSCNSRKQDRVKVRQNWLNPAWLPRANL